MAISMYSASSPVFQHMLNNLAHIMRKGEEHGVSLETRLAPDMFPLSRQVQIACDMAKSGVARLAGVEVPTYPDTETTYPELQARIARTVAFVGTIPAAQIDGSEEKSIVMKFPQGEMTLTGEQFLAVFTLPNLYFHITMAYAILRHAGVALGKMDFMRGG